jgi:uncharacterized membrane protein
MCAIDCLVLRMLNSNGGNMAFCSKCGSGVSDGVAFCGVCGSPVSTAGAQTPPLPPPPPQAAPASAGMSSNVVAALAYFFITGIIFLLMDQFKRDKFVRFHSFQAVAYGVITTIFWMVWNRIVFAGFYSFGFLWTIFSLVNLLISLALFAFWLFLMYKAYNNETYKIPVIGDWAEKQAR